MFWRSVKKFWLADPKQFIVTATLSLVGLAALSVWISATVVPQPRLLANQTEKVSVVEPLIVRFSLPVARRGVTVEITPPVDFETRWSGGAFGHLTRTMIITPEAGWEPNQQYEINFTSVQGAVGFGAERSAKLFFTTDGLPEIAAVSVSAAKLVRPDEAINVTLDQAPGEIAEFFFSFIPEAENTVTQNGGEFEVAFNQPLAQGVTYTMSVERQVVIADQDTGDVQNRSEKQAVFQTEFTTVSPVLVSSVIPQGSSVLPTIDEVKVVFSEAMERDSVLSHLAISPVPSGQWQWVDDLTAIYLINETLPIDTQYTLTIAQGAKAQSGSFVESDQVFSFGTVGALHVAGSSPRNGASGISITNPIEITFDQPVVPASVVGALSVSPAFNYQTSWSGNTLKVVPTGPLAYYTSYQVRITAGAQAQYGQPLAADYVLRFTSAQVRRVLNIALDYQDRPLSCEAAALKMALRYRGITVSEADIMNVIGYDPTIKNGGVWGDPDIAFVGNIDGSQNSTGYGVHWDPVARAARTWRNAAAFSGWSASQLAKEIEAGNPVVIWGVLGGAYFDPWYTPSGRYISAWKGEHARTVIGYTGSTANPTSFIINDPISGRVTWSTAKLLSDWSKFNNSGVVVY
ncbi:MAG: Ig-like domain-containing protein [Patescibacteria group bacterium]